LKVKRRYFECIQDFSLDGNDKLTISIPYKQKGGFIVDRPDLVKSTYGKSVFPFMVRTDLASHMEQPWFKEAYAKANLIATEDHGNTFEDSEFEDDVREGIAIASNVFKYTTHASKGVYGYFCDATLWQAKQPRDQKKLGFFPDVFQPVMLTSRLLRELYTESDLQSLLHAKNPTESTLPGKCPIEASYWLSQRRWWRNSISKFPPHTEL
jgi:hypothetical protein